MELELEWALELLLDVLEFKGIDKQILVQFLALRSIIVVVEDAVKFMVGVGVVVSFGLISISFIVGDVETMLEGAVVLKNDVMFCWSFGIGAVLRFRFLCLWLLLLPFPSFII